MQEGVEAGLRDLIINNVPKAILEELNDQENGFLDVMPLELLAHIHGQVEVVSRYKLDALIKERDIPINFEGEEYLKSYLKQVKKLVGEIHDHHVTTSESEMLAQYLLEI